jgi:hypothetical protein
VAFHTPAAPSIERHPLSGVRYFFFFLAVFFVVFFAAFFIGIVCVTSFCAKVLSQRVIDREVIRGRRDGRERRGNVQDALNGSPADGLLALLVVFLISAVPC